MALKLIESPIIKVITGPRRSGKSVLALKILESKGEFGYLNFDDENIMNIGNYDTLFEKLVAMYPKTNYFLFDEIQNLNNWELFINKLHRRGYNITITGSNSKLLSKELSSHLTGRFIECEVLPFSFKEYQKAKKSRGDIESLKNYIASGGYPEVITTDIDQISYLSTLLDSILFRDIVQRYDIRSSEKIYELSRYLISNFAKEYSFRKLQNVLNFQSTTTIISYLGYLEETYIFFTLNRFSFKRKEQLNSPKKFYAIDTGFPSSLSFSNTYPMGQLLENLVAIELIRRGYRPDLEIFYYRSDSDKEVDFLIRKTNKIHQLIQVAYSIKDSKARERELNALEEASSLLGCKNLVILTWNEKETITIGNNIIHVTPVFEWLMNSDYI